MDGQRFDGMAKKLAVGASRRGVFGGLLAAGAGMAAARTVGAAKPADPGNSECAAACRELFPEASNGVRRDCVKACVQGLDSGKSGCAEACREQFPEAKKGVRRRCVKACVQASEEVAA